jgi:hypothetical protein
VGTVSVVVWAPFAMTSDISFFSCGVFAPLCLRFLRLRKTLLQLDRGLFLTSVLSSQFSVLSMS